MTDARQRAFERALKSISVRERTESEVREFLTRRGYEREVIGDVVRSLREEGLVDDAGYARRFAEDRRLIDQWGSDRIARDLARRGIGLELIEGALSGIDTDDEMATAIQLLDRRFPMPFDGDRERDKAWRMLVRRGYQPELAYSAVRRHEQGLRDAA
jgi:regulatory protein